MQIFCLIFLTIIILLFLKKLFREALPIYDEILKLEPNNADVINNKGYALSKMKNYDDAISCYDKGLEIKPTEKCLLINKISSLRKSISLVSQDVTLFDDTIKNNIAYANLEAQDKDIVEAAKLSFADEFIKQENIMESAA